MGIDEKHEIYFRLYYQCQEIWFYFMYSSWHSEYHVTFNWVYNLWIVNLNGIFAYMCMEYLVSVWGISVHITAVFKHNCFLIGSTLFCYFYWFKNAFTVYNICHILPLVCTCRRNLSLTSYTRANNCLTGVCLEFQSVYVKNQLLLHCTAMWR